MKKNSKVFLSVVVILVFLVSITCFASQQMIEAVFNNIKISINGQLVKSDVEPFIYNGRTYIPARAVAEGMGGTVKWNSDTNTVEISEYNKLAAVTANINRDSLYILSASSRLNEIQQSISLTSTICNFYEKKDSDVYNIYYETFKINRDSFYKAKKDYELLINEVTNRTISKNNDGAKKIGEMISIIDESINIQNSLFITFDLEKYKRFVDNTYKITTLSTDIRFLMLEIANQGIYNQ